MIRRVLSVGCWDVGPGYPRAANLLEGMRRLGVEVDELRIDPPGRGVSKAALVRSPRRLVEYRLRSVRGRRQLRAAFEARTERRPPDLVLVPYPGHLVAPWVRRWFGGPIVLDLFLSSYGTVVEDRRLHRPGSPFAWAFRMLDRRACRAADLVLLDTPQHADYVHELTGLDRAGFDWVPVSDADDAPPPAPSEVDVRRPLRLLFFGTGVPLHGLSTLLRAVETMDGAVELTLVGGSADDRRYAASLPEGSVVLREEFIAMEELRRLIDNSDLVAGVFGASRKADMVVPFKVVHSIARARAVLTADTTSIRAMMEPERDCLVCPAGDPDALARRLRSIADDPSELARIGERARARFEMSFSIDATARRLTEVIEPRFGAIGSQPTVRQTQRVWAHATT